MAVLKWLVALALIGYFGLVAVFYFMQRTFLFPIPQTVRTTPAAAGFPEAEEHVLTTADGEKVIVWHVPAKPGRSVVIFFPGNGDFLAGRVGWFATLLRTGPDSSRCHTGDMRVRPGIQASEDYCWMPRRLTVSQETGMKPIG